MRVSFVGAFGGVRCAAVPCVGMSGLSVWCNGGLVGE